MRRIHYPHEGTVTLWFKSGDDDDHGDSLIFCRNFFMLPTVTRAGCGMCAFSTRQEVVLLPYYSNYSVFYGFNKNPQSIVHTEQFGRCLQQWWLLWYRLNVLLICYGLLPLILGVLIFTPKKYEYSLCSLLFLVLNINFFALAITFWAYLYFF